MVILLHLNQLSNNIFLTGIFFFYQTKAIRIRPRVDADVGSEKTLRLKRRHWDGNGFVELIEANERRGGSSSDINRALRFDYQRCRLGDGYASKQTSRCRYYRSPGTI